MDTPGLSNRRSKTKAKKKAGKTNGQKTVKAKVYGDDGRVVLDANGKPVVEERPVFDLNHPGGEILSKDIHDMFMRIDRNEFRKFKRENPDCKKAIRQSSTRARRHANQSLDWVSQVDDWLKCRPYFIGETYTLVKPVAVTGVAIVVGSRIPFIRNLFSR